ncbi:MAG: hypothetical protein LBB77_07375 [Treponema sp.]|jgi:hypothetical protein|nr:hypothetical protein [Treponema sp.]
MRDLLNFIFANIVPIIIVVSIALRIIGGLRGQARKRPQPQTPSDPVETREPEEEYVDVWKRLEPDEDEGPRPALAYGQSPGGVRGPEGGRPPAGEARPLLMPASTGPLSRPTPVPPPSAPVPPLASFTPEAPRLEPGLDTRREAPSKEQGKGAKPAPVFSRRIENLSPLRRAVILAEIIGPPRGLSRFPGE